MVTQLPCTVPQFRPMSVVAKWLDGPRCHLVWRYALAKATLCSMGTQLPQKKVTAPSTEFLAHVYCGQTAGWIKMTLRTEVNLVPDDVVLDVVAAPPPPKRDTTPSFRLMSIVAKLLDG